MRQLHPGLAAHLAGGVTTTCRCWKLTRRDGAVLGFTDHDRDIAFGGTLFRAATGLDAAEATQELGLAATVTDVAGALVDGSLTEEDLVAGPVDDAAVGVWLVNWQAPDQRLLIDAGTVGEVRRSDMAFFAEIRSLAHRLDEERGRVYAAGCDADLGDTRCGVSLASAGLTRGATVGRADGRSVVVAAGLDDVAGGFFTAGRLTWLGGAKDGITGSVRQHLNRDGAVTLVLWEPSPLAVAPGDAFRVTAGCDKTLATCRDRFANLLNFRGFPHIPGNDVLLRYARAGQGPMDGGSLFR